MKSAHACAYIRLREVILKAPNIKLLELLRKTGHLRGTVQNQNYDHIFLRDHLNPDYKLEGSFMFVPIKSFFGNQIPTFWYNILIIWLFNIVLFIALYFDALKKVMSLNLFYKKTV